MRHRVMAITTAALSLAGAGYLSGTAGLFDHEAAAKPPPPPRPCDLGEPYQCQPINNDAALQRVVDDLGSDPSLPVDRQRTKLGTELCSVSLVLTGVDVSPAGNPLTQRVRRIEDLGSQGRGGPVDPGTVPCAVIVRGAPESPPATPAIRCAFTDGSQCQPVNNDAALLRVTARVDAAPSSSDKLAILAEEGCAVDRVSDGVYNPAPEAPLTIRWNALATKYNSIAGPQESLVRAQETLCPGLHSAA